MATRRGAEVGARQHPPGLVVAAPQSGGGKTTITLALIAALRARGHVVQPFKVGPDFIDPGHLTRAAGRVARNLDVWMTSHGYVAHLVAQVSRDADLAIVEGMMGFFDGVDGASDRGSTAELAALLGWPVVLVVDASAAARSVAAVVRGFRTFSPEVTVAAVVFDRVGGPGHLRMLRDACSGEDVLVLGGLRADPALAIGERHLGLHVAGEPGTPRDYAPFAEAAESQIDLEALLRLARASQPRELRAAGTPAKPRVPKRAREGTRCRIAVARDDAFCFYYEDNLELLREAGAEIVEWSPLAARKLPDGVDGLYFGGGYPELHTPTLAAATSLHGEIRNFAVRGGMIYAECGGFMFLSRAIRLADGSEAEMVGLLPGVVAMRPHLAAIGYRELAITLDGRSLVVRGQEFRSSELVEWPREAKIAGEEIGMLSPPARAGHVTGAEGIAWRRVVASYVHLHFASAPELAEVLVARAAARRKGDG